MMDVDINGSLYIVFDSIGDIDNSEVSGKHEEWSQTQWTTRKMRQVGGDEDLII